MQKAINYFFNASLPHLRASNKQSERHHKSLYRLISLTLVRNIYIRSSSSPLLDSLIHLADQALAFRRTDVIESVSQILTQTFSPQGFESVGMYYHAVYLRGKGQLLEGGTLLEQIEQELPPKFKARAINALGMNSFLKGDIKMSSEFWREAHKASLANNWCDPLTTFAARQNIAILKSLDGDHFGSINDLRGLSSLLRTVTLPYPHIFYNYSNSIAVELGELGRLEEARHSAAVAVHSPYAQVYPEWHDTYDEITYKMRRASPSVINISSWPYEVGGKIIQLPIQEPKNNPFGGIEARPKQPAQVFSFLEWKRNHVTIDPTLGPMGGYILSDQKKSDSYVSSVSAVESQMSYQINPLHWTYDEDMKKTAPTKKSFTVFLSHSSKDRWIAKQMANLIENKGRKCGIKTFLDEKDIEGGDSIHKSIQRNIKECNEFVVLLSKNSINRPWVLIELGAAWILGKRIIAIIDKVTPQEMPDIIAQYKGIDINSFDDYITELIKRQSGERK